MFEIHERLRADTFAIGNLGLSQLLLHRSSDVPWFILVPVVDVVELHLLEAEQRATLSAEVDRISKFTASLDAVEKINVAAIGNLVPQMHIHVIGRHSGDPFWPGVVWGREMSGATWETGQVDDLRSRILG